jgi:two-component system, LuxR family, response regulator FixJ
LSSLADLRKFGADRQGAAVLTQTKIYVVDDDEAVRDSLALQFEAAGYDVATFASAVEFLEAAPALRPGCVVSDVRMPQLDGIEMQARLAQLNLDFPVIIMTGHGDVALAVRAMKAGAVDFVEKPFSGDAILDSIRQAQLRASARQAEAAAGEAARQKLGLLTPRERDVFDQLVRGKQNKVIAAALDISPRTVEVHRARVLEKLEARSLSDLVRLALAAGSEINP